MSDLSLGFIGVGTIAKAIIKGLLEGSTPPFPKLKIFLGPRSEESGKMLANQYEGVQRLSSNQAVVEASDKIFLCVPSQNAAEVLQELSFEGEQSLISLVAMASQACLREWSGHKGGIYRAVPLPFIEKRQGMTPFYPEDNFLKEFFGALGGAIPLSKEEDLSLFLLGGSMMGVYYRFLAGCENFLQQQGLEQQAAHQYLTAMFGNLADVMRLSNQLSFQALEKDYSTKKGTNEMLAQRFEEEGGLSALEKAARFTLKRITG